MFPPVFAIASTDSTVQSLLGTNPVKLWAFGEAPRDENGNPAHGTPYAVWQIITGAPYNYISNLPDSDSYSVQVDAYAESISTARDVARSLRDCLEPHAHITSWNGEWRDSPTNLYRVTFTIEFLTPRTET
jgi:hypothetical protein